MLRTSANFKLTKKTVNGIFTLNLFDEIVCFKCQMVTQWKLGKNVLHAMARNFQHSDLNRNFAAKVLSLILS